MHSSTRYSRAAARGLVVALALLGLSGCGGSDDEADAETTTAVDAAPSATAPTTEAAAEGACRGGSEALRVVLVNDELDSPENDVFIEALSAGEVTLDITLMAPTESTSGTSDSISPARVAYTETTTPGGTKAYSVDGLPADTVIVALNQLDLDPHLVIAGVNLGHNFGTLASISSTMGIGRTAVRRDVPALTVSSGLEVDDELLDAAAGLALGWIADNCEQLAAGDFQTDTVTSLNVPACAPEDLGELKVLPRALEMPDLPEGQNIFESSCDLAVADPTDDVTAVHSGYPTLTQVEPDI